jgi:hypothetical protein
MLIIRGDAQLFDDCVKIARELPDYFTNSGIINLVEDMKTIRCLP